jgi:flagellin-like protein
MKILLNKKGITPIISVILLLMMVIAIATLSYTWLQRMERTVETSAENSSGGLLKGFNVQLRIEGYNTTCTASNSTTPTIFAKNTGTEKATNLQLYVDGQRITEATNSSVSAGDTIIYVLNAYNCSDWINLTKKIKLASDETITETSYDFECTTGSC